MDENAWYEKLRMQYKPQKVRVVFVGESAPASNGGSRRFFYAPELRADNLFRGLMLALYAAGPHDLRNRKPWWLERFQRDGFWLLDVANRPINRLTPAERRRILRAAAPVAVERIRQATPALGVVVCHGPTFDAIRSVGEVPGLKILHRKPVPFPLGNYRGRFVEEIRTALRSAGIKTPII